MAVAEERVRVGDALVRAARDAEHRLAAPDVLEPELEPVHRDQVAGSYKAFGFGGVADRVRAAGEPPAVVAPLGGTQRRVREHVLVGDLLAATERLEDRPARELVGAVAQHRPVRDLARRSPARPDGVEQPARAGGTEPVEVGRLRGLVAGAALEHVVRAVAQPVQQEDDDRIHLLT